MLHLVDSRVDPGFSEVPQSGDDRKFHAMFQMATESSAHWGSAFRGYYTLTAIAEIVSGYQKNGEMLKVWLLEDEMSECDKRAVKATFESLEMPCEDHCNVVFQVCPTLFAASHGLERAVGEMRRSKNVTKQPNQVVNGLSAMACAVMDGWRPDIATQLTMMVPSGGTLKAIMALLEQRRMQHPDDPDLYQRECREAVVKIFKSELEIVRMAKERSTF
jgi:hypothetical protein